jgi:hypothetical protein
VNTNKQVDAEARPVPARDRQAPCLEGVLPREVDAVDLRGDNGHAQSGPEGHGHLLEVVDGGAGDGGVEQERGAPAACLASSIMSFASSFIAPSYIAGCSLVFSSLSLDESSSNYSISDKKS